MRECIGLHKLALDKQGKVCLLGCDGRHEVTCAYTGGDVKLHITSLGRAQMGAPPMPKIIIDVTHQDKVTGGASEAFAGQSAASCNLLEVVCCTF